MTIHHVHLALRQAQAEVPTFRPAAKSQAMDRLAPQPFGVAWNKAQCSDRHGPHPLHPRLAKKLPTHGQGKSIDFSLAQRAYDHIDPDHRHHADLSIVLPNQEGVVCRRLGKNEPYGCHRVGSVTKTFTSLLALKLCHDGVLAKGLQTRCADVLPPSALTQVFAQPQLAAQMTLEQLLSHTAGVEFSDHCRANAPAVTTLHARLLAESGSKYVHLNAPGEGVGGYSNAGIAVAGWLLEFAFNQRHGHIHANGMPKSTYIPFSQIMVTELLSGVFGLRHSKIAPGPSGDIVQNAAGDLTSSTDELAQVAAMLQKGEVAFEHVFGPDWHQVLLRPRDLLQHHGLGCAAGATALKHAGMNREMFPDGERDVTAIVILPLRKTDAGLVALCDSSALGPKPREQALIAELEAAATGVPCIASQPTYDPTFYCPDKGHAFTGDAMVITDLDPFSPTPKSSLTCSRNGMKHVLQRDVSLDSDTERRHVRGYRDQYAKKWLVMLDVSCETSGGTIYSDYCRVTQRLDIKGIDDIGIESLQPSAAEARQVCGVYRNTIDPQIHPTYTFTESGGHLWLRESGDDEAFPCLRLPDGSWVASNPAGRNIKIRFPTRDGASLEITDFLTGKAEPPFACVRQRC